MPITSESSTRIARALPLLVPTGGVTIQCRPDRAYRVWGISRTQNVTITGGTTSPVTLTTADLFKDVTTGSSTTALTLTATTSGQDVIVEPVGAGSSFSLGRSPLAFILQNPTLPSSNKPVRKLIGSFFDLDGRELFRGSGDNQSQDEITIEDTAKTLYTLARVGDADFPLYADCWEFRGMLVGGPIMVTPFYLEANPSGAIISDYLPKAGAPMLFPGPVVIGGGSDNIWQVSTNPGVTVGPVGSVTLSTQPTTTTPQTIDVDFRSCVLGILYIEAATASGSGSMRVIATRATVRTDGTIGATTSIANEDQTFVVTTTLATFHVELPQGYWKVKIEAIGQNLSGTKYWAEYQQ